MFCVDCVCAATTSATALTAITSSGSSRSASALAARILRRCTFDYIPRPAMFRRALSSAAHKGRVADFAFALDIDGVLQRGKTALPGAAEALQLLEKYAVPYVLMTNGGGTLESAKADAVSAALHHHVPESKVIVSHSPMKVRCLAANVCGVVNRWVEAGFCNRDWEVSRGFL